MSVVTEHYEAVLARHYSKLAGDFEAACGRQRGLLERAGVLPAAGGRVLDLGCGAGLQSVPLARAGYAVTGVDFSPTLLAELRQRAAGLPVTAVEAEMLEFAQQRGPIFALALCMGDTLLHLPSREAVAALFAAVARRLEPEAAFVVSFRDLTVARAGLDRFIRLVAEPDLLMRCFLEYRDDHVMVHDLIDERGDDGQWIERRGAYPKLRLSPAWVQEALASAGFTSARAREDAGLWIVSARVA